MHDDSEGIADHGANPQVMIASAARAAREALPRPVREILRDSGFRFALAGLAAFGVLSCIFCIRS